MSKEILISYDELNAVIEYDSENGTFTWKVQTGTRSKAGSRAGVWQRMQNGKNYYSVTYKGRKFSAAYLAWLLYYKVAPDRSVFYIDENPENFRISNLKLADHKSIRVVGDDGKTRYEMTNEQVRHYSLARFYGMTIADYDTMHERQNGCCAICNKPETAKIPGRKNKSTEGRVRILSVDHDHETGKVRELLCNACNHILGEAGDNAEVLEAAARYIRKHAIPNVIPFKAVGD